MSEEEVDMELLRMMGEYLTRGRDNYEIKTSGPELYRTIEDKPMKWVIKSPRFYGLVCGDIDGKIEVETSGFDNISERVAEIVWFLYKRERKKAKNSKEKHDKIIKEIVLRANEIQDELASKNNWDKYSAQKPFEKLMRLLKCGEKAAKKAGGEFGVEVIHWVSRTPYEYNHFYSIFDPKGMSREQKFEEVKKRVDAVCRAGVIYYKSKPKHRKSLFG